VLVAVVDGFGEGGGGGGEGDRVSHVGGENGVGGEAGVGYVQGRFWGSKPRASIWVGSVEEV
jgi:hypothetical protein